MSSNKKIDFAKELVDFLAMEKEKNSSSSGQKTVVVSASENNDKAIASSKTEVLAEQPVEFDLEIGSQPVEVNLTSSWRTEQVKQKTEILQTSPSQLQKGEEVRPAPSMATEVDFGGGGPSQSKVKEPQVVSRVMPSQPFAAGGPSTFEKNTNYTAAGQAEAMRVAQQRINQLENERDQIREQSEKLLVATESLQRRLTETRTQLENLNRQSQEKLEILEEEKAVLKSRLQVRETEMNDLKKENDDLKLRFQTDLRKVRIKERDLENRLELMRAEHAAVMRSKDDSILDLRRQIDQLEFEIENYRAKTSEMNAQAADNHERNHRLVKTLRLALSMLEGEGRLAEDQLVPLKKVSG